MVSKFFNVLFGFYVLIFVVVTFSQILHLADIFVSVPSLLSLDRCLWKISLSYFRVFYFFITSFYDIHYRRFSVSRKWILNVWLMLSLLFIARSFRTAFLCFCSCTFFGGNLTFLMTEALVLKFKIQTKKRWKKFFSCLRRVNNGRALFPTTKKCI
jgi:hypothetical protein